MRRGTGAISGQPILLGAVTILLAVVIVYFVYRADSGLPFVPTYHVRAVVPDAQNIARNAEVRLAGVRIGRVGSREVRQRSDGSTEAVLGLELEKSVEPLPAGTTVRLRATSSLGGNYVEVVPGRSEARLAGSHPTVTENPGGSEVTLSDALEAYDARTREGASHSLTGYGNALAGRGADLNGFVAVLPATLRSVQGSMRVLGSDRSALGAFIAGLSRLSAAVAPVAEEQARGFAGLDATVGALDAVRGAVAGSAQDAPPALRAGIAGLPRQRALLRATTSLVAAVAPGLHAVHGAADDIEHAATGAPAAFDAVRELSPRLASSAEALLRFARDDAVIPGLETVQDTLSALRPTLVDLRAAQVVCNYPGLLLRNLLSVTSDGDSVGNWVAASAVFHLPGTDSEFVPSAHPSNGSAPEDRLHASPAPYTGTGPQGAECEAGAEGYAQGRQVLDHAPGHQPGSTEDTPVEGKAP